MAGISLLPIFMVGLLGSVHCVGMCGGIVSALSMAQPTRRPFPVPVVTQATLVTNTQSVVWENAFRVVMYNTGRISSYAVAGAIAGGVANGAQVMVQVSSFQLVGYVLANLMLLALGLYLMDAWRGLTYLERGGQVVWRHVQPLIKPLLPMDSPLKALALGGLWGWLPCGMVYSVLLTAMMTSSAASGALVMLAFGLGTLPTLLTMGMLGNRFKDWARRRNVRLISGLIVLSFGVIGLVRVANGFSLGWLDMFCVTPTIHG